MKNTTKYIFLFSLSFLFFTCSLAYSNEGKKEEPVISKFKGKNLVTFGNSITAAKGSWAYLLSEKLEFGNLYNGALGGAVWSKRERISDGETIVTQNYDDSDFAGMSNGYKPNPDIHEYQKRINNCAIVHIQKYLSEKENPTPDIIILSYGTNDSFDTAVIGDADKTLQEKDVSKIGLFTMAGAVKWCIHTLKTEFPDAEIYIALPLQSARDEKNNGNLKKIAIIKKICDAMSVTYFDCYAESGITKENSEQYLPDGLHPNEEGKKLHATYIMQKLKDAHKYKNYR